MTTRSPTEGSALAQRRANLGWARILVDELVRGGVRHVALSPGSRSTPLAWAVAERAGLAPGAGCAPIPGLPPAPPEGDAPTLELTIHIDERSASFFAVGRSRVSGAPSALVCTSGTAGVNYGPAVVEAWHSQVPLLLLTADRPPELRDSGAWQTIDQTRLFTGFLRWFCDVSAPRSGDADGGTMTRYLRAIAARAAATTMQPAPGPVHLNLPFREPLAPPSEPPSEAARGSVAGRPRGAPWTATAPPTRLPAAAELDDMADGIAREPRGMVLAGTSSLPLQLGSAWGEAMAALAEAVDWPILAEPTGGLRFGSFARDRVLSGYAAVLRHAPWREAAASAPGMALRFGGSFTWKHVALYLGHHGGCTQIFVDPSGAWDEPTRGAARRVIADPLPLMRALTARLWERRGLVAARRSAAADWQAHWRAAEGVADAARRAAVAQEGATASSPGAGTAPFHDLLARALPAGSLIWVANSMAVRDLDSFTGARQRPLFALASRGAAGIDGTLSTALGAAAAHGRPTCLITGDLAFLHDLNGLGLQDGAGRWPTGLALFVLVLDDGGGGIFEHLPVADREREIFEPLFATPPRADLAAAAGVYGHPFALARTREDVAVQLAIWHATGGVRIVRVPIDRAANTAAHRAFWAATAAGLDDVLARGAG